MGVYFWLFFAIIFLVIEGLTSSLTSIWFTGGAIITMLISYLTDNIIFQVAAFIIISAVLLVLFRPFTKKYIHKNTESTNADRYIGQLGQVVSKIEGINHSGEVKVLGRIWRAEASEDIEVGETVKVLNIKGAHIIVEKSKGE